MRRPSFSKAADSVRYAVQDALFWIGRLPRALGSAGRGFWQAMSARTHRRLGLAGLGAAVAAIALALLAPVLPCQLPGGDVCAPADEAAEIVPADALGYLHASFDPDEENFEEATEVLAGVPSLSRQVVGRLLAQVPGPGGEPADFGRDVAPWFGGQAALAIVPAPAGAEQVQLLEEGDSARAAEYADSIAAGSPVAEDYRGVEVSTDARGLATASVGGFLAIGTEQGVRRLIDVDTEAEGAMPLADDPVATELRDELPAERFAQAYLSEDGIESLVAGPRAALATVEPFIDAAASRGAAASLGASDGALEVAIRSSLDAERAEGNPGFFAAFPEFEPELPERLAPETLGYVGLADPGATAGRLVAQATAEAPALAEGFAAATERLRDLGRVDVEEDLLPALEGESAFALQPGPERGASLPDETTTAPPAVPGDLPGEPVPTPAEEPPVPILQFVADGVDAERARGALASLQGPIAEALDTGATLQAPVFDRREVDGVSVQVLRISPTVNLTYALADERLAVATQPQGVEEIITGDGGLSEAERFEAATEPFSDEVSMLAYLDLSGLLKLGEREGLAESPAYAALAPELRRLEALGLSVAAEEGAAIATDARLVIAPAGGDGEDETGEPPAD